MTNWDLTDEIRAETYEELQAILNGLEEAEDPFSPEGEDPVDLYGPWWE